MASVRRDPRTANRSDRGAVAVEAALVLPLVLVCLLGTVDASLWLRDTTAVSAAARHGARIASAQPRQATMVGSAAAAVAAVASTLPAGSVDELWIYQAGADGLPLGSGSLDSCPTRCVRLVLTGSDFRTVAGSWPPSLINACVADPNAMSVGVALRVRHRMAFSAIVGGAGTRMVTERSVLRFEPMPARSCGAGLR